MRIFVSFEGKKARQLEHSNHCIFVDSKAMKTVFDFFVHLKRKFKLKDHYVLSLSLQGYFVSDSEGIQVLHDNDSVSVRISKLNDRLNPYPELKTSANSHVGDTNREVGMIKGETGGRKGTPMQVEGVLSESTIRKNPLRSQRKDREGESAGPIAVSTPLGASQPDNTFFLPRKFQLRPVAPRAKINLGSNSVSNSSLNSRKDRGIAFEPSKSKVPPSRGSDANGSKLDDSQDGASSKSSCNVSNARRSVENDVTVTQDPDSFSNPSTVNKTSLISKPKLPAFREIKKGHIKFDDADENVVEVVASSEMDVDYSPIVKPSYVETPPLDKPESLFHHSNNQKPETELKRMAEAKRINLIDNVIEAYNRKMESILNDDEDSTSDDDEQNGIPGKQEKISEGISVASTLRSGKVIEKKADRKSLISTVTEKMPAKPVSKLVKSTPGLNIGSVISQLNKELSASASKKENSPASSIQKKTIVENSGKRLCERNARCDEDSSANESIQDILRRSREYVAKRGFEVPATDSSDFSMTNKLDDDATKKRKLSEEVIEQPVPEKESTNEIREIKKRGRFDISDEENQSDVDSGDTTTSDDESQSVREIRFSVGSSSHSNKENTSSNCRSVSKALGSANSDVVNGSKFSLGPTNRSFVSSKKGERSSSDESTSEDEAVIKANIKRTNCPSQQKFGAVWSPKLQSASLKVTSTPTASARNTPEVFPKAKPNKSWCEREPQTNKSEVIQKKTSENSHDSSSKCNGDSHVSFSNPEQNGNETWRQDKVLENGTDFPSVNSMVRFKVVDLDDNFRPELMEKSGQIVEVDHSGGVVQIKLAASKKDESETLSKRAAIFKEALTLVSEENGADVENTEDEIREFRIAELSDVQQISNID